MTDFQIGEMYWTVGLNMLGKLVKVQVKLVKMWSKADPYGQDCVTESKGIKVMSKLIDLYKSKSDVPGYS